MKLTRSMAASASVIALAAIASLATNASAGRSTTLIRQRRVLSIRTDRSITWDRIRRPTWPLRTPNPARGRTWETCRSQDGPWDSLLLTDGTVIVEDFCTVPNQWYKLTPDSKGKYNDGTWSAIATMPSGYAPLFFAPQILPDGRMIVNGGEYNAGDGNCGEGLDRQGRAL